MLLVVLKLLNLSVQSILRQLEFLGLLAQNLVSDLRLQAKHGLFEEN